MPGLPPTASMPPVRARLYRPSAETLPLVVDAHGGYFVLGDLDSHDRVCRRLALEANAAVLAVDYRLVDYRLATEHPAPAAIDADLTMGQPTVNLKGSDWGLDVSTLHWAIEQWVPALASGELRRQGVEAVHLSHPGLVHGFLTLDTVSSAAAKSGQTLMHRFGSRLKHAPMDETEV